MIIISNNWNLEISGRNTGFFLQVLSKDRTKYAEFGGVTLLKFLVFNFLINFENFLHFLIHM